VLLIDGWGWGTQGPAALPLGLKQGVYAAPILADLMAVPTCGHERVAALHHDLNAAINLHRKRFPESSWADVQRALELTAGQVGRTAK
jgi:hypothetical protein